ncbi:UPF0149 family protein [Luteimonas vadosa]|uniref:YecA family protein n=1 Tax=Luteimonas vadosa TaxID=1165507 RepID=A0ABP9E0N5_9GAMM
MSETLPALHEVESAIRSLGLAIGASELHGSVCGWLAGGGEAGPGWLTQVMLDEAIPAPTPGSELDRLLRGSADQLEDRGFGFTLLLPADDASLAVRSGALFDWCRGFVGGLGLAAGDKSPPSEEGREALKDLAKLAAATAQDDGDDEDEAALAEIEEFVRVAVLLLHGDCAMGPRHRGRLN